MQQQETERLQLASAQMQLHNRTAVQLMHSSPAQLDRSQHNPEVYQHSDEQEAATLNQIRKSPNLTILPAEQNS